MHKHEYDGVVRVYNYCEFMNLFHLKSARSQYSLEKKKTEGPRQ